MDKSPTPRERKAIAFFIMQLISIIVAICAIFENNRGPTGVFSGALALIVGFQIIYSVITTFSDWGDRRRAKRPTDPP